ncbi:GTPase IMAP family member 7 [Aplysia californica]|uniref:GTPase IMAP family member 7 n=1 Tax=Aplysia californica TaxID=6500 RepID=A0ABM0KAB6_APLCA|nr:GTPase IMAP family member 7 [Aplysia californica]
MAQAAEPVTSGNSTEVEGRELVLFLLGKTGHGKSSTGNTILARPAFETSDNSDSVTFFTQSGWSRVLSRLVQVVDGPGVCETRLSRGEAAQKMITDMSGGIALCPNGFDALIIVCRYGIRFTEEEHEAVESLKSVFGANFIRDFGIVIFTHGDQLDANNKKRGRQPETFETWCRKQSGHVRSLMDECDNRCLLFRNMDEEPGQVELLLQTVERLKQRGVRYSKDMFHAVRDEQERFITRENAVALRAEIQKKISLLQDGLNRLLLLAENTSDIDHLESAFESLQNDITALKSEIKIHDKGTGVLDSLKDCLESMGQSLLLRRERMRAANKANKLQDELDDLRIQIRENERQLQEATTQSKSSITPQMVFSAIADIAKIIMQVAPLFTAITSGNEDLSVGPTILELSDSE